MLIRSAAGSRAAFFRTAPRLIAVPTPLRSPFSARLRLILTLAHARRYGTTSAFNPHVPPLKTYRAKRDFSRTPEPPGRGKQAPKRKKLSFVVQEHAARRLHYDFRLELDGVLLSWAVPKGPSLDPGQKRLAVRTEDHPLEYGGFEGIIPEGEYGAGPVIVWDRGTWQPENDPHEGLRKGHLAFTLSGEKLHGRFHLVRTRGYPYGGRESWLLIKGHDDVAVPVTGDIVDALPRSVLSGRTIEEVRAGKPPKVRRTRERVLEKATKAKRRPSRPSR